MDRRVGSTTNLVGRADRTSPIMPKLSTTPTPAVRELKDLTRLIQRASGFPEVLAALKNGRSGTIDGAWGSAGPLAAAALGLHAPRTLLIVLAHVGDVDDFRDDVATFAGIAPEVLPAWERTAPRGGRPGDEVFGRRLRVVKAPGGAAARRGSSSPRCRRCCSRCPAAEALARCSRTLRVGDDVAVEELTAWLMRSGDDAGPRSSRSPASSASAAASSTSSRPTPPSPVRIEFFGDEIESIRPFDAGDPALARPLGGRDAHGHLPLDGRRPDEPRPRRPTIFPEGTWVALVEPNDLREEGRQYLGRVDDPRGLFTRREHVRAADQAPVGHALDARGRLAGDDLPPADRERRAVLGRADARSRPSSTPRRRGDRVLIACHNAARGRAAGRGLRRHRDSRRRGGST